MRFPIPDLAVEVLSDSTAARDRGVKFEDYAAHGVAEYWIVDPEQAILEQYLPGPTGDYALRLKSSSGTVSSVAVPGFVMEIEAFFDSAKNLAALRRLMSSSGANPARTHPRSKRSRFMTLFHAATKS